MSSISIRPASSNEYALSTEVTLVHSRPYDSIHHCILTAVSSPPDMRRYKFTHHQCSSGNSSILQSCDAHRRMHRHIHHGLRVSHSLLMSHLQPTRITVTSEDVAGFEMPEAVSPVNVDNDEAGSMLSGSDIQILDVVSDSSDVAASSRH